ncbi:MAG TPA: SusC/RagA family TonB-linked outer membrane protein [Chitinophaga sp.]|uniref:SusC/RagA family TonB-linked outer membrane protein n=1 Tax=Chitinophaga sp. TaxID=1869181 RepID=UPI002D001F9F|nr:SusC/RagA family TonB-linked outer membrane protein [Chitinophaga sp.]HVI43366.1 SusC/RagA family TonB-linked outer membrane protein [Chitinophaga sp.]
MQQFLLQALRSDTRSRCVPVFIIIVILVLAGFVAAAQVPDVLNKRISLHFTNASLKTVIREIEKQTKYTFAISSVELETRNGVNLHVHNTALQEVLRSIFPTSKYKVEIKDGQIIVIPQNTTEADTRLSGNKQQEDPNRWQLSGIVTDGFQPLSGVSVREKGTQNGTATGENGSFSLSVASGQAILSISLIGYETKEINIRDRRSISAILQPDLKKLNELVVLGYGLQRRANITGAIAQVEGARLKSRPVPNVMAALQGTATGLVVTRSNGQPGKEGFNIQVRGVSTGSGNNTPVIVDGVPGSLAVLNPDDIESVSILKDAAAASVYGARGAGGVVLVTTRSGKPGRLSIDVNGLAGFEQPIRLPNRLHSWEEASMMNEAAENAGKPAPWQPSEIAWMQAGNHYAVDYDRPDYYRYYYDMNQLSLLTKTKTGIQNYNISVKGGDTINQFSVSLGYFGRQGLFAAGPDKTHRVNARVNFNRKFNKHFSLETRFSYAQTNTLSPAQTVEGPQGLLAGLFRGPSNVPVYVPNTTNYAYGGAPVYAILQDGGRRDEKNNYVDAVFTLRADSLLKGLTLRLIYSPQQHTLRDNLGRNTLALWNRVAPAALVQPDNMLQKSKLVAKGGNMQVLADYETKKDKHNFHLLGGSTLETFDTEQQTDVTYAVTPSEVKNVNFLQPPQYSQLLQTNGSLFSVFGKLSYNYDNRYLLEVNLIGARLIQNSSIFPHLQQWQGFPSFSAGWRLNNETWFSYALPFFNEFKLRWSWGRLGNVNSWNTIANDERYQTFTFGYNNPFATFVYKNALPQASGWENISTNNYGWDASLFRGRLTLSADYFVRRNRGMQIPVHTSSMSGAWPLRFNTGEMKSWGWEVNVGWRSERGPFTWYINANIFNNQNKVLRNEGVSPQPGWNQGIEGYPYSSLFGYVTEGYFPTADAVKQHAFQHANTGAGDLKYKDINGDNKIDRADLVYLGSTDPQYSYGIDAGFSWKGFDFSVFFQGVANRKVMPDPRYNIPFTSGWEQPWDINRDHWTPDHQQALFPRLYINDNMNTLPSDHWTMNGAYIRLKNLQLGYTLPASLLKRTSIRNVRLYFSGQDLWETNNMKIKYYDPEQAGGYNGNVYPFFRSYTVGVGASF